MIVVVLVPCTLGFHFFVRWPRDRLRRSSTIVAIPDLRDTVSACGGPIAAAQARDPLRHYDADSFVDQFQLPF